jgi:hypothetical protein
VSLRDWSLWRVLALGAGWIAVVLVIALPRVLGVFTAQGTDGHGGMVGLHIAPGARWVVLAALGPALLLVAVWLGKRAR